MMEVIYRRKDGVRVRTHAYYSFRNGPVGEWMIGQVPLHAIDGEIISMGRAEEYLKKVDAMLADELPEEAILKKLESQFDQLQVSKHIEARRIEAIYRADTLRRMIREQGEEPCA